MHIFKKPAARTATVDYNDAASGKRLRITVIRAHKGNESHGDPVVLRSLEHWEIRIAQSEQEQEVMTARAWHPPRF